MTEAELTRLIAEKLGTIATVNVACDNRLALRSVDYEAIAMRWLPRGYAVEYRKDLSGRHYGDRALIKVPRPTTPEALFIFLHECAHAYLHTGSGERAKPRYMEELEAEMWAHAKMTQLGIPVPAQITDRAKRHVAYKIVQAERRGAKNIDPRAIEYAGEYLAAWRRNRPPPLAPERLAVLRARRAAVRESAIQFQLLMLMVPDELEVCDAT